MIIISLAALLAFIVTALLLLSAAGRLPFGAFAAADEPAGQADRAVFRRQMAELEKMRAHGLIDDNSAGEARLELARYILAAEKAGQGSGGAARPGGLPAAAGRGRGFRWFLSGAILFVPVFSLAVYYIQGRPDDPAHPFAEFMARSPETLSLPEQIVRLEALSARNPRDGRYADRLAAACLQAGRFQDAANAYNQALALNGDSAERLLGYALALTGFEDGVVGKDAEAAFRNVLRLDPHNSQAQLFLARGLVQSGKKAEAVALLQGFLRQAPAGSAQRQDLQAAIAALENPPAAGAAPPRGKLAANITDEQRRFIAANLGRLEARLKAAPGDLQAWTMLINAYLLLGQRDKAQAALQRALAALLPADGKNLADYARQKGLSPAAPPGAG